MTDTDWSLSAEQSADGTDNGEVYSSEESVGTLAHAIDVHLRDMNLVANDRALGVIHPSEIFYCPRAIYYCRKGIEPIAQNSPKTRLLFDTGHALHAQFQRYLQEIFGDRIIVEALLVQNDPPMVGHADGILMGWQQSDVGFEFKTISSNGFKRPPIYGSTRGNNAPLTAHLWQVHCYMRMSGIGRFIILYYNKDTSDMREFLVEFDDRIWLDVEERLNLIESAVSRDDPPEGSVGARCSECRYQHVCPSGSGARNERSQYSRRS